MEKRRMAAVLCALMVAMLLPTAALAVDEYDLSSGNITIEGTDSNNITITYGNGQSETDLTLNKQFVIKTGSATSNRIVVNVPCSSESLPVKIKLNGVTANVGNYNALNILPNTHVALTLEGANSLSSGGVFAAVHVPAGAFLTLLGSGTLTATGFLPTDSTNTSPGGAAIGGNSAIDSDGEGCGSVTINGGVIKAMGGNHSAGIGGGGADGAGRNGGSGGTITINDGTVEEASGGSYNANAGGAGIGGGGSDRGTGGSGGTITINGGTVKKAGGGSYGAGIGGGGSISGTGGASGSIILNGGIIAAGGGATGAGIGGGSSRTGTGGTGNGIAIHNGSIYAWDGGSSGASAVTRGAAIGGGAGTQRAAGTASIASFAYEWMYLEHVNDQTARRYTPGPWSGAGSNAYGFVGIRPPLAISPASGAYGGPVFVSIVSPVASANIWYTLDGSDPAGTENPARQQYVGPFLVTPTARGVQVKAYTTDNDPIPLGYLNHSAVATAAYSLDGSTDVPKTGDDAPLLLLCMLLLLSGAGLIAGRRRKA